ncbi:MAG: glucose-6-phosphate isomerase [Pirellulaceae bacterium]|nr:glucose-6-phosphate isomerase [Pirellulaceae bacterium]
MESRIIGAKSVLLTLRVRKFLTQSVRSTILGGPPLVSLAISSPLLYGRNSVASPQLLRFNPAGAFHPQYGLQEHDLTALAPALERARREMLDEDARLYRGGKLPEEKDPLDHGFFEMPEQLLKEQTELNKIGKATDQLKGQVDRVVVLGIGGSYMGARALLDACRKPYFNELARLERDENPRIYFEGNNIDNDASQGLLRLLKDIPKTDRPEGRWGIVVISKSGETIETAVAFRQYLAALTTACGGDLAKAAQLVIPVTGEKGRLADLAGKIGCAGKFLVPDGVGGRFSILSAVGLVPAALMGLKITELLQGAAAMNEHFRTAPPETNVVLQYVGATHLLETRRGANIRVLSVWSKALESAGLWYDQLLAESLGKRLLGATPLTTVNTRDLHSRAQQHQEGKRDKVFTNVIVDKWTEPALPIGSSMYDQDQLNQIAAKTLPDLMSAAIQGTNEAYAEDGRPTMDLHLPALDEHSLGQFFQMLMIATVIEGRLLGINPYGQPGVQKYKANMKRILGMA